MQAEVSLADRESWLRVLDSGLAEQPELLTLQFERALTLESLGRASEAEHAYNHILHEDPDFFPARNNLARINYQTGRRVEAFAHYKEAVIRHPENAKAHANFAFLLLRGDDPATARLHYERALVLEPDNVEAHRGLTLALQALGENTAAASHHARGFDANPLTVLPYRGEGSGIRTLLIVSSTPGNIHFEGMLDEQHFAITKIIAESEQYLPELPPHDLLINTIGDADIASAGLAGAQRIVARSNASVINHPSVIAATRRTAIAQRLRALPNVQTAHMQLFSRDQLLADDALVALQQAGFAFPLLIRTLGFHTGQHFLAIDDASDLVAAVAKLPGEELLVLEYIDTRDQAGRFCKYRVMAVGGKLYPLHAAVGNDWKVHYFSAQMDDEQHIEIDAHFLTDMHAHLGEKAIASLQAVAHELSLDYGGIDFALDAAGQVVVFEANATMIVPRPNNDARWAYRQEPTQRIYDAVHALLQSRLNASA